MKSILFTIAFMILMSLAQETEVSQRIINITYDGGNRSAADLRYGPYIYDHPAPEGVVATVSNLTIYGQFAELKSPDDVLISEGGEREAIFDRGVRVTRGRLVARGNKIIYSEATGFGVLDNNDSLVDIVIAPSEDDGEPANITAQSSTFDVDTDVSVSRGNVTLISGSQNAQADEVIFEEDRDLAKLISNTGQVIARRTAEGDNLIIQADIMRFLTEEDKLLAIGNVTIIDGDITSSGDKVFFDDEISRAEVIGNPAVSIDSANGVELSGPRLEQRTDIDVVQILDDTVPSNWDEADFTLNIEGAPNNQITSEGEIDLDETDNTTTSPESEDDSDDETSATSSSLESESESDDETNDTDNDPENTSDSDDGANDVETFPEQGIDDETNDTNDENTLGSDGGENDVETPSEQDADGEENDTDSDTEASPETE